MWESLAAPARLIADNAGLEGAVTVAAGRGRDRHAPASTRPPASSIDLVKAGIIDPAKVTRAALQNAASIAPWCSPPSASWPTSPRSRAGDAGGGGMGGMGGMPGMG